MGVVDGDTWKYLVAVAAAVVVVAAVAAVVAAVIVEAVVDGWVVDLPGERPLEAPDSYEAEAECITGYF